VTPRHSAIAAKLFALLYEIYYRLKNDGRLTARPISTIKSD